MSRLFDDASSESLDVEQAVWTGTPMAFVCQFNSNDAAAEQQLIWIGDKDVTNKGFYFWLHGPGPRKLRCQLYGGVVAIATAPWSVDTWHHACGIITGSFATRVLLDGANKGTAAGAGDATGFDRTSIGRAGDSTPGYYMSGMLAEVGIYDLSVWPGATDSDKADNFEKIVPSLALGCSPRMYPLGLVSHWKLVRGLNDEIGGYNLTASGTIVVAHPRVIYPIKYASRVSGIIVAEPDTLAVEATLQTPAVSIDCTVTPSTLALTSSLHAPAVSIDYTATPATLALEADLLASTVWTGIVVAPSALALALTQQIPTLHCDCTVVLGSALALTATLQTPIGIIITFPGCFPLELALLAPEIIIDCTATPSVLALALTQQTPTISIDYTALPTTLAMEVEYQTALIKVFYIDIPSFMQKDIIDPYSGGAWLWLCQIAVPGQSTERIARNTEDIVYGEEGTFDKFNFQIGEQMFSGDGSIPRVTLRIFQDVNRRIENLINATEGALGAEVKLIRVCEKFLETPVLALEADYENLASESDSEWATFTLGIPNPLTQRIPLWMYRSDMCPYATPTLFKGPECQYSGEDSSCTGTYEDCFTKGNAVHWGGELGLDPNVVRV